MFGLIALVALAYLFTGLGGSSPNVHATVVEADNGTFRFEGIKDGKVIVDDGPFASAEAAQTAADNWVAAQNSKPAALGCAGSGTDCHGGAALGQMRPNMGGGYAVRGPRSGGGMRAQLGQVVSGTSQALLPYTLTNARGNLTIDIRNLHAMHTWTVDFARSIGIRDTTPAGVAVRAIVRAITGGYDPSAIKFGTLGTDGWREVMAFVRHRVRPFTWAQLVLMAHSRIHQLGLADSGSTSEGPGPGETGVNAAGGLYVRTRGERRL